jgi:hypothetical protein
MQIALGLFLPSAPVRSSCLVLIMFARTPLLSKKFGYWLKPASA